MLTNNNYIIIKLAKDLNVTFHFKNQTIKIGRMGRFSRQSRPTVATKGRKTTTKVAPRLVKNDDVLPNLSPIRILKHEDEEDFEERNEEAAGDKMYLSVVTKKCKNIDDHDTNDEGSVYDLFDKEPENTAKSDISTFGAKVNKGIYNEAQKRVQDPEGKKESNEIMCNKQHITRSITNTFAKVSDKTKAVDTSLPTYAKPSIKTLTSFGFESVTLSVPQTDLRQRRVNSSKIRIVVIYGFNGEKNILLRCEPTLIGPSTSSWSEKVIFDALKIAATWTKDFNINPHPFNWYANNIVQNNSNGYPIRLFHIPFRGDIDVYNLLAMLKYLCEVVMSCKGNKEKLIVNRHDLFWLEGPVVWSDVIGISKSISMIKLYKGNTYPGFFEDNDEFVLTYFRREDVEDIPQLHGQLE
jgi:hypothetical protein